MLPAGLGRLPEALALADDTLDRMRRKLGDRHPLTLSCVVNLANCRGDSGDPETAEALECETITLLRDVLDASTLTPWSARPTWPYRSGRRDGTQEAEDMRTRVIADFGRVLGASHPDAAQLDKRQRINRDLEPQQI